MRPLKYKPSICAVSADRARGQINGVRRIRRKLLSVLICGLACDLALAETIANETSALGVNLQQVSYYTSEQPFLDVFKTGGGWITHADIVWDTNEEKLLDLDSTGWPRSLNVADPSGAQKFTSLGVLLFRDMPATANGFYPAGQYVVLFNGEGKLTYSGDARLVASSKGRDVISVQKPSAGGIEIRIIATNPRNYIRDIRVVKAENEVALKAGQIFNPKFLDILHNFRALRFMQWFNTNETSEASWTNRAHVSDAFWGTSKGVPLEVAIQLANAVSADAWLNIPVAADDDYMSQMGALVSAQLHEGQRVYVELSNEVWNGIYPANAYSIKQGMITFPRAPNKYYAGWEWYGMRVAQMADIWFGVFGVNFSSRVTVVMSGQSSNPTVLAEELSTPDWVGAGHAPAARHHVGATAIAPYFGGLPSEDCLREWVRQPDGGLEAFFQSLYSQNDPSIPPEGFIGSIVKDIQANLKVSSQFKLPLMAYEGGQSFEGFPKYQNGSQVVDLFVAANRDVRMKAAYDAYLRTWKSNGGTLFMQFIDTYRPNQYGEWGALESLMQTVTPLVDAPPKWQAIQNFISSQTCWWDGCRKTPSR